jgi:hypothetical protein
LRPGGGKAPEALQARLRGPVKAIRAVATGRGEYYHRNWAKIKAARPKPPQGGALLAPGGRRARGPPDGLFGHGWAGSGMQWAPQEPPDRPRLPFKSRTREGFPHEGPLRGPGAGIPGGRRPPGPADPGRRPQNQGAAAVLGIRGEGLQPCRAFRAFRRGGQAFSTDIKN